MRRATNQNGFAIVEVVLVILLLAAVGAAGYFAYQAKHTAKTVSVSQKTQPSGTQSATPATQPSLADAVASTKTIYNYLVQNWGSATEVDIISGNPSWFSSRFSQAASTNGAPGTANNDGLPLVCGGSGITVPDSLQFSGKSVNGDNAVVDVEFVYSGGGNVTVPVNLVSQNSKWLMDGVACNTSS